MANRSQRLNARLEEYVHRRHDLESSASALQVSITAVMRSIPFAALPPYATVLTTRPRRSPQRGVNSWSRSFTVHSVSLTSQQRRHPMVGGRLRCKSICAWMLKRD